MTDGTNEHNDDIKIASVGLRYLVGALLRVFDSLEEYGDSWATDLHHHRWLLVDVASRRVCRLSGRFV